MVSISRRSQCHSFSFLLFSIVRSFRYTPTNSQPSRFDPPQRLIPFVCVPSPLLVFLFCNGFSSVQLSDPRSESTDLVQHGVFVRRRAGRAKMSERSILLPVPRDASLPPTAHLPSLTTLLTTLYDPLKILMTRFTTFLSVFTLYSLAHAIPVPRATPAIDSLLLRGDSHLVTRQTEVPSFPSQYPSCVGTWTCELDARIRSGVSGPVLTRRTGFCDSL